MRRPRRRSPPSARASCSGGSPVSRFGTTPRSSAIPCRWTSRGRTTAGSDAWASYAPVHYEPKDFERQTWLERRTADLLLGRLEWSDFIGIGLFLLVAV